MPELPEVETIKNGLNFKILNKNIVKIKIKIPRLVRNSVEEFNKQLLNSSIKKVLRRGKLMIFVINENLFLIIHLKMTGQLVYKKNNTVLAGGHSDRNDIFVPAFPNKYSHIHFIFEDQSKLFFNDLRQFGYLEVIDKKKLDIIMLKFGIEPLGDDFTLLILNNIVENKKRNIKALLLDQSIIAGIGNIYADEILFSSKISPLRQSNTLNKNEIKKLYFNIKFILKEAIRLKGTTFSNYVDEEGNKGGFIEFLKVYQREKQKCLECGDIIKKIKVASRGTRFCPNCQK